MGKKFFKNLTVKNLSFKNKMIMAPISSNKADEDGFPKEFHYLHYGSRIVDSVGAVIVEGTAVDKKGRKSAKELGIWSDKHIKGLKKIALGIKDKAIIAGIQLFHGGNLNEENPIKINEIEIREIKEIIKQFKVGAKRAIKAGFDIIEINAGEGYLIESFLSVEKNKRADEYGGDIEGRAKFLLDIIDAIKSTIKDNKLLAIRLSADSLEKMTIYEREMLIKFLEEKAVDLVDINRGLENERIIESKKSNDFNEKKKLPLLEGGFINLVKEPKEIINNYRKDSLEFSGMANLKNSYWMLCN